LHAFFIEEDEAHEQRKPFTGTLHWSDPRAGKQKTLTKHGTIQYVPITASMTNAATSSSILETPTAPSHISTPVRAASAPLIDIGGYETESLPVSPVPNVSIQPPMAYLQPVPTAPHPPIQVFNVNHRTRLTAVTAKDIKAFMAMLKNKQKQKRTLTSEEAEISCALSR
jgi:hypothetical protein